MATRRSVRVTIRAVTREDAGAWLAMRCALWPEGSASEHRQEIAMFFDRRAAEPLAVLVAEKAQRALVGMAELSIRSHAEGCHTDRVGYLEGWYVEPGERRAGVGRALLEAAEDWARGQGCTEFASDTQEDNDRSAVVHRALGFADVGLVRCFRKDLAPHDPRHSE